MKRRKEMNEKRQLSEAEKQKILAQHGRRCFVDGEPIPKDELFEFHHIKPYSSGGPTSLNNIAPVCKRHHCKWQVEMHLARKTILHLLERKKWFNPPLLFEF